MKDKYRFQANCIHCNIPTDNNRYQWLYSSSKETDRHSGITTQIRKSFSLPLCNKCFFILVFPFKLLSFLTFFAYFITTVYLFFLSGIVPLDTPLFIKILGILFGLLIPAILILPWIGISKLIEKKNLVRVGKHNDEFIPTFVNKQYQEKFLKLNRLIDWK